MAERSKKASKVNNGKKSAKKILSKEKAQNLSVIGNAIEAGVRGDKASDLVSKPAHHRKGVASESQNAKMFVLDTNVLMHDPSSIFRFEDNDIYIPMMTLEELDNNKKGLTDASRHARMVSRVFDEIIQTHDNGLAEGIALDGPSDGIATGRIFFQSEMYQNALPASLPSGKGDNQILSVVMSLQGKFHRDVVLVSKDINMRIKARALGIAAEDYLSDQVLNDQDLLPTGRYEFDTSFWGDLAGHIQAKHAKEGTEYQIDGNECASLACNEFITVDEDNFVARVVRSSNNSAILRTVRNYASTKNAVCGIVARNAEQNMALNLLMDRDIDFVTLLGQAGSGKTLLAMAAAIQQTVYDNRYSEIIVTRATVPVGEDIGFLPGTEVDKMEPWFGAIEDNLEVLSGEKPGMERPNELGKIKSRIKLKSMSFMRGRTFLNKYLIIDEAQNLTPKQMKTLITRAGPGTKIVCMGNIAQIDTPYLTEGSSGLTYVVNRFRNWEHSGHLTLVECVRSRLADHAGEVL